MSVKFIGFQSMWLTETYGRLYNGGKSLKGCETMSEMQIFNNAEFGQVRTTLIDGQPWFVAGDVCKYFDVTNRNRIMQQIDDDEKGGTQIETPGGMQNVTIISESGLYTLLFALQPTKGRGVSESHIQERVDKVRRFKRWVTHEVLPSIRKTGAYIMGEEKMTDEELLSSALIMANNKLEQRGLRIKALEAQIELDRPKTIFYDAISASTSSISFGAMAKLAHNNGYDIGRNRFVALLIEHGFVMRDGKNLVPTQRAINLGVLEPKESYYGDNKTGIRITCVVTGKGQVYFMDFLYKLFNQGIGA